MIKTVNRWIAPYPIETGSPLEFVHVLWDAVGVRMLATRTEGVAVSLVWGLGQGCDAETKGLAEINQMHTQHHKANSNR